MKKNKKSLYAALASAAMFTLAPNVYADSPVKFGEEGGSQNIDVQAVVDNNPVIEGKEYYVVISWTNTNGIYTSQDLYSWDAVNLKYVKVVEDDNTSSLTGEKAKTEITITNQSNDAIQYSIEYATAENMDTTENAEEGYEKSGTIESAVSKDYQLPATYLDTYKDTTYMTAKTSTYKGEIALNKYSTSGEVKLGTYTVNISKVAEKVTAEGEKVANLSYTGTAVKGGKITIGDKQFTVLSNEDGVVRAMLDEYIDRINFASVEYWKDDFDNGTLKQYDSIDLNNPANLIRPLLDIYADTLGIDKTSVTLPTYAEVNGLTQEQRTVGFTYWTRSIDSIFHVVYTVWNDGGIYDGEVLLNDIMTMWYIRPVVVIAA